MLNDVSFTLLKFSAPIIEERSREFGSLQLIRRETLPDRLTQTASVGNGRKFPLSGMLETTSRICIARTSFPLPTTRFQKNGDHGTTYVKLPFLDKTSRWPTANEREERVVNPSYDKQIQDSLIDELLVAVEKKDARGMREAISALAQSIRDEDHSDEM